VAKVSDLIRRVEAIIDDTIYNITLIDWFNGCNNNIAEVLYMPTLVTLAKDADGDFVLPLNCNGELKILSPQGIEVYSIYDNTLYFDGATDVASIQITYNRLPAEITNNPDLVPDIPAQFHDIYVFYAAMQAMHPEEEPTRYKMYEQDYLRMKGQIQKYMGKMRPKPAKWGVVR
jgi:hypothetical protein